MTKYYNTRNARRRKKQWQKNLRNSNKVVVDRRLRDLLFDRYFSMFSRVLARQIFLSEGESKTEARKSERGNSRCFNFFSILISLFLLQICGVSFHIFSISLPCFFSSNPSIFQSFNRHVFRKQTNKTLFFPTNSSSPSFFLNRYFFCLSSILYLLYILIFYFSICVISLLLQKSPCFLRIDRPSFFQMHSAGEDLIYDVLFFSCFVFLP